MSAFSNYLENELVKHIFRTGTFTKPTVLAVALHTADPTDAGTGAEVSGGGYTRIDVPPLDTNWAATSGTDGETSNLNIITFPDPVGADWGLVTHFSIRDALSGGNQLFHGPLTVAQNVTDGGPALIVNPGELVITLA